MADRDIVVNVKGMSCKHCARAIEKSLSNLKGVRKVKVDVDGGTVACRLTDDSVTRDDVVRAIQDAGYEAA